MCVCVYRFKHVKAIEPLLLQGWNRKSTRGVVPMPSYRDAAKICLYLKPAALFNPLSVSHVHLCRQCSTATCTLGGCFDKCRKTATGEGLYHKKGEGSKAWTCGPLLGEVRVLVGVLGPQRAPSIAFLCLHQAQLAPVGLGLPADCERASPRPAWCLVTNEKVPWFRTTVSRAPQHNEVIMTLPLIHFGPSPAVFSPPSVQSLHSLIYLACISCRNL